jgi:hypothetical protein
MSISGAVSYRALLQSFGEAPPTGAIPQSGEQPPTSSEPNITLPINHFALAPSHKNRAIEPSAPFPIKNTPDSLGIFPHHHQIKSHPNIPPTTKHIQSHQT